MSLPPCTTYSTTQAVEVRGVSERAFKNWIARYILLARQLAGGDRLLSNNLEAYLQHGRREEDYLEILRRESTKSYRPPQGYRHGERTSE